MEHGTEPGKTEFEEMRGESAKGLRFPESAGHLSVDESTADLLSCLPPCAETSSRPPSPGRILLVSVLLIVVAEAVVMGIRALLPPLPVALDVLVDAAALGLVVVPVLRLSMYRPMQWHIQRGLRCEQRSAGIQLMLQRVIDLLPARVFWKDRNLEFLGCNVAFARAAGKADPTEVVGKDDFQLAWAEQAEAYRGDDRKVMESGIPKLDYEECQTTPTGEKIWVETSKVPLTDLAGNIVGVLGIYDDITERKQAQEDLAAHRLRLEELVAERTAQIEAQREQLERANRLKSEFLSTMSHELRTPLNSVLVLSRLLLSRGVGRDPSREMEYLRAIERNGSKQLALINDVLNLSQIEAGGVELSRSGFRLRDAVEQAVSTVRPVVEEKGLSLKVVVRDDPVVRSDAELLEGIVAELLDNAAKFTSAGEITVILSSTAEHASVTVADTGIGIARADLPHLFEKFWQGDSSDTRPYGGTGLGLAISQRRAALLEGTIEVVSELGRGSTFTLVLPLADPAERGPRERPEEDAPADTAREDGDRFVPAEVPASSPPPNVLVVEDSPDNMLCTVAVLEALGYSYATAENGKEALSAVRETPPSLVLMDIQLPVMGGLEATQRLKAAPDTRDIPVIALTAKAMKGERESILAAGCDDYLSKPLELEEVSAALNKWLAKRNGPETPEEPRGTTE